MKNSKNILDYLRAESIKEANATGLKWEKRPFDKAAKDRGIYTNTQGESYFFQYFCKKCGGELEPGPTGAGTNQVCKTCKINYGCLPGAPDR